jgi:hypothetical protein
MRKSSLGGSGRLMSSDQVLARRRSTGLVAAASLDLNTATPSQLAAHPLIGKRLAAAIVKQRKHRTLLTAYDLGALARLSERELEALDAVSHGRVATRNIVTSVSTPARRCYVSEPFAVDIAWAPCHLATAELLVVDVRFPSGERGRVVHALQPQEIKARRVRLPGFASGDAGEFDVMATLHGNGVEAHRLSGSWGVFTRNPVQMFISPGYWTQSGTAGAPKYNFAEDRWYCHADVRWVNGTAAAVNLGRRVSVRMTDAGIGEVGSFSFDLSGDVVVPAWTTVYGNLFTWHGPGGAAYDEYIAKGDLTYAYEMSGGGHTVARSQIWRAMRTMGYNLIRVGDFSGAERAEYQRAATEIASDIYRSRDMTVYGAELYRIEGTPDMEADKTRFRFIDSQAEINALRSKYTVDNWYLDTFMVEGRWDGAFGSSPVNGPDDKNGDSSGLVVRRDGDTVNLGQTFAHEGGHYLGLEHADEDDGCADTDPGDANISDNFIFSSSRRDSDVITGCQINTMRRHGLVRVMTP